MNSGRTLFAQLMDFLPLHEFRKCVRRYRGEYKMKTFSCFDQFLCLSFAQLTGRDSLRDIEICLLPFQARLYHAGFRGSVSRNNLSHANQVRPWGIFADFAQVLIRRAGRLYHGDSFGVDLDQTAYAFDSTTIYILDRGYIDFTRLHVFVQSGAFFVTRAKHNMNFIRLEHRPVDTSSGLRSDQTIRLRGFYAAKKYPDTLRLIRFVDPGTHKSFVFLTNNFMLPALTIAQLYKCRWQVELFFKWIKQNLRIKSFYGTSENAVKTQIWIAICVYVLLAIVKKELNISRSLSEIQQILSISIFEKVTIAQSLFEKGRDYSGQFHPKTPQLTLLPLGEKVPRRGG
jgi:hypothetical protein